MEDDQNIRITLDVSPEQMETITQLFAHYDWDYREIHRSHADDSLRETMSSDTRSLNDASTQTIETEIENEGHEENTHFHIEQDPDEEECRYCLCKPCITSERNRQLWWEDEDTNPSPRNYALRKEVYKRFWTMMFHRDVWNDPRYTEAKIVALQNDPRCRNLVWHRRDIMPKCVLSLVRGWFPNLPGAPYLGHLWE